MPKCGTTTVATMLSAHPAICMHSQKEPGDFLRENPRFRMSGYTTTDQSRWIADFTTSYGLTGNRARFFRGLRSAGIQPDSARYVLCLRDPADLARSYMNHMAERRGLYIATAMDGVRAEILSACDFDGAVADLEREIDPDHVFIVRFEDLHGKDRQRQLSSALFDWLDLPPLESDAVIWENVQGKSGRYPAFLDPLACLLRRTNLVRNLSPDSRARVRKTFSRTQESPPVPTELVDETLAWLEAQDPVLRSRALLSRVATGRLSRPENRALAAHYRARDIDD